MYKKRQIIVEVQQFLQMANPGVEVKIQVASKTNMFESFVQILEWPTLEWRCKIYNLKNKLE